MRLACLLACFTLTPTKAGPPNRPTNQALTIPPTTHLPPQQSKKATGGGGGGKSAAAAKAALAERTDNDGGASAAAAGGGKGGKDARSIEQIYQKKTQLEHILLRPDTYSA